MSPAVSLEKIYSLAAYCGVTPTTISTWKIEEVNIFAAHQVMLGWRSFGDQDGELCLSAAPPEYEVNCHIVGHLAVLPKGTGGYLIFGLVRGLQGDERLPAMEPRSRSVLARIAWDIGTAFSMRPSIRPSTARAIACKYGARVYAPPSLWQRMSGGLWPVRRRTP